jgi:CBS domain-containing protein
MSADKPGDEAAASDPEAEGTDSVAEEEEVEPEIIAPDLSAVKHKTLHPPPPPRLRDATGSGGRRLEVSGEPQLARDLMTRELLTIAPDDPLVSLEEQMEKFRFRHVPVVDGNKLVGLITQSDLFHASSSYLSETAKQRNEIIHKLPAKRIMRTEPVTVRPSEPLASVAALMWKTRSDCVLVTDQDSNLLGILTQSDFVRLAHHHLTRAAGG